MIRNGLGLAVMALCLWTGAAFAKKTVESVTPLSKEWSILWVIDNSSSFVRRRQIIKQFLPTFGQKLHDAGVTGFRMGVTTTDYFRQQGFLIAANSTKVVNGETEKGQDTFKAMLDQIEDSPTAFWEQGLEAGYQAIVKEGNFLIRQGVPLAVIYITDENDYSCENNCSGVEPEHNPNFKAFSVERYAAQFKSMGNNDIQVYPFPVVGLSSGSCQVASYGERYLGLMNMMGRGHSYSVCEDQLERGLDAIAEELGGGNIPLVPPKWTQNPIEAKRGEGMGIDIHLLNYVEGGPQNLTFSKVSGPSWGWVTPTGMLEGTAVDIGDNVFVVRACIGNNFCADTQVRLVVVKYTAPVWTKDPIVVPDLKVGKPFTYDLAQFVSNPTGTHLQFTADSLPTWMWLEQHGQIGGIPDAIGKFKAVITVNDGHVGNWAVVTGNIVK